MSPHAITYEKNYRQVSIAGRGTPPSATLQGAIFNVYEFMAAALGPSGISGKQIITRGKDWNTLDTHQSSTHHGGGSRLDHFVASALNVSVYQVHEAKRKGASLTLTSTASATASFVDPQTAGRPCSSRVPACSDVGGQDDVGRQDDPDPENLRIALVLGRTAFATLVRNAPENCYQDEIYRLMLAGLPVGQKHHDFHTVDALLHIGAKIVDESTRLEMLHSPTSLRGLPGCWGLAVDGGTLDDGTTVLALGTHYTTCNGDKDWALLDAPSHGVSFTGIETARLVVNSGNALLKADGMIQVPRQFVEMGFKKECTFWDFLVVMPCDGAMVGHTGIKLDYHTGCLLGRWGTALRMGHGDYLHLYDNAGGQVFKMTSSEKRKLLGPSLMRTSSEADRDAQANRETDTHAQAEAETDTGTLAETKTESETETEAETDRQRQTETDRDKDATRSELMLLWVPHPILLRLLLRRILAVVRTAMQNYVGRSQQNVHSQASLSGFAW